MMNLYKQVTLLSSMLLLTAGAQAQRLKATVDKEFKVKNIELSYQGTGPGPVMFFDAKKHSFLKLGVSDKVMGAVFDPSTWTIVSDKNIKKLAKAKKSGYEPIQFSYLEGKPVALMRKDNDKDVRRVYMQPFDNNFEPIGRRPIYIGRGAPCNVNDLRDKVKIITDNNSKHRGYLSSLNCSKGEAITFSYLSLDAEGKTIFEKKFRTSEDYNRHDGELIVYDANKAFYVVVNKGSKGRNHEGNGLYEIIDDKETKFFPLEIRGYVVRDFTAYHGKDDNLHLRGMLSKEGNLSLAGVFSMTFDVAKQEYTNLNIQQLDGESLKESLKDKKRLKPKQIDPDAPAPEYIITGSHLDRNENIYLFAQDMEVKSERVMQVATGVEEVIRHAYMRDIMVIKIDADGILTYTEIVPSSNVYTNHMPERGYSFFFHDEQLYVLHPSYQLGISTWDTEESEVNQPQMLNTLNNEIAATIINKEGLGDSRTIFDLSRKYASFDPSMVLYDRSKNKAFILAKQSKKRTKAMMLSVMLPEVEEDPATVDAGADKAQTDNAKDKKKKANKDAAGNDKKEDAKETETKSGDADKNRKPKRERPGRSRTPRQRSR